jgi:hypothetical protein
LATVEFIHRQLQIARVVLLDAAEVVSTLKRRFLNPAKPTPLFSCLSEPEGHHGDGEAGNIVPGIFRKALQDVEIKGTHHKMHMATLVFL